MSARRRNLIQLLRQAVLREALGRTDARRRKPAPRVDPALVLAVGRIGGNLNQIARWLNPAHAPPKVKVVLAVLMNTGLDPPDAKNRETMATLETENARRARIVKPSAKSVKPEPKRKSE